MRLAVRAVAIVFGGVLLLISDGGASGASRDDHQTHPNLIAAPEFRRVIGAQGSGPGEFTDPGHVAIDSLGRVTGGPGNDTCRGGSGQDTAAGCESVFGLP
ncbi:MAG: hypothetical protein HKN91_06490 [Acidimicrobiia bacterium]|nr:hypothetical protein [Acidimicrobiia bacterium]